MPNDSIRQIITEAITTADKNGGLASVAAIIGVVAAFWSASEDIGVFMRASNSIYDVPEGRPIWKTLPIRLGVTAVVGVLLLASAVIVVFTGRLAEAVGDVVGLGSAAVTVWDVAKRSGSAAAHHHCRRPLCAWRLYGYRESSPTQSGRPRPKR